MRELLASLERLSESRLFAYGTVLLLQAKLLWGIWDHRDLTPGDTGNYFVMASRWADELTLSPDYYPLYHLLWGSMQWVISGAYEVAIVHRVLIVLAVAALVLAVMRRLLTPGIAWLIAVWWVVLPINYDTLYEVHLFALIPTMIAVLVAARWPGLAGRSAVFGILLASALLTRNENLTAALAFGAAWIGYEVWQLRREDGRSPRELAAAIATPVAVFLALLGIVAFRDEAHDPASIPERFSGKHELNVCQVYAYSAWQRGDRPVLNPLTKCEAYTRRDFGEERLSLREAVIENPGAMGEHFVWNAKLFPAGLQVSLFDAAWPDPASPDFFEVRTGSLLALAGSILVLALLAVGCTLLWRERRRWWEEWIRERAWAWIVLAAIAASSVAAALLTRPRPSYLFNLTILILAVLGLCGMAALHRWPSLARLRSMIPLLAGILLIAVPNHYREGYANPQIGPGQAIREAVDRLEPFRDELSGTENVLLAAYPEDAVCPYLDGTNPCTPIFWQEPAEQTNRQHPAEGKVDYVYASEKTLSYPAYNRAVAGLERSGWERLAPLPPDDGDWVFLRRPGGSRP